MVCLCCDVITHYVLSCSVTSSEKVDKAQRYADFTLLSIPYPGRESFQGLVKWQSSKDRGSRRPPVGLFTLCPRAFWDDLVGQHSTPWLPYIGSYTQGRALSWKRLSTCRGPEIEFWLRYSATITWASYFTSLSLRLSQVSFGAQYGLTQGFVVKIRWDHVNQCALCRQGRKWHCEYSGSPTNHASLAPADVTLFARLFW